MPAASPIPAAAPISGFTTILGVTINPMVIVLALVIGAAGILLWRAQRDTAADSFDAWDLVMEPGPDGVRKASVPRIAFMSAFVMSSWVIVDCQIKHTLTEGIFGAYLLAWVGPLAAKVIFNKSDPPALPGERRI